MDISTKDISKDLMARFEGINAIETWGETTFFYNPQMLLKRGVYFCTIKEKDGPNDKASNLSREGIFRVNFGLSKKTYLTLFDELPKRPNKGCSIDGVYDFEVLDTLTPHPIYGWMAWVSILNPAKATWDRLQVQGLLLKSYAQSVAKHDQKILKNN